MNAQPEAGSIAINVEPFSRKLFEEIVPLARKCWAESTIEKGESCAYHGARGFDVEPDAAQYEALAKLGALVTVTLRDAGTLIGYVVGFLYHSQHHSKIVVGNGDSIYIEPGHRYKASAMIVRFEQAMKELGAQMIGWPVSPNGPVHALLKARGYVADEVIMEKLLCVQ